MEEDKKMRISSLRIQWHLTEVCNLHCQHCYQTGEAVTMPRSMADRIWKEILALGEELNLAFPLLGVSFTGGEPLLVPWLWEWLDDISKDEPKVLMALYTNGLLLDRNKVRELKRNGFHSVQLSLEGARESNDRRRGAGTYAKVIESIRLLEEYDLLPQISMTLDRDNKDEWEKMIEEAGEHIYRLNLRRFVPWGRGGKMKDKLIPPREMAGLYRRTEEARPSSGCDIYLGCEEGIAASILKRPLHACAVRDKRIIAIMSDGKVYPCRRLPIEIGDLNRQSLSEILRSGAYERSIEGWQAKECHACPELERCGQGAPCVTRAYYRDGGLDHPDPQCPRLFRDLPPIS